MDMNLLGRAKNRFEALKQRFNCKALVSPAQVETKPTAPRVVSKDVDWQPPEQDEIISFRECKSREKMNRTRAHRQAMKKFHKHQARMNPQYRVAA